MSLEATNQGNYVDDGATCSDQVDGMISQNVEVSGAVVNLTREGEYVITYSCADSAGYEAVPQTRTVFVHDCNSPTCTLIGDAIITREAFFPYEDAGAWCTDDLDGLLSEPAGTASTIADLTVDVENTGTYYVTYFAEDEAGNQNFMAQAGTDCDGREGAACNSWDNNDIRTVHIVDTLKPVIALNYNDEYFHYGDATDTGIDQTAGQGPGATGDDTGNPVDQNHPGGGYTEQLIAESASSSLSGWMVGAIASAVTGLALLGYSRNTVPTTVPV